MFPLNCNVVMKVNCFWREKQVFDLYLTLKPEGCRWIIFWNQDQKSVRNNQKIYKEIFGVGKGKRSCLIYSYYQRSQDFLTLRTVSDTDRPGSSHLIFYCWFLNLDKDLQIYHQKFILKEYNLPIWGVLLLKNQNVTEVQ